MASLNTSKVDGNTVSASEWNQLAEVNNFVTNTGQTPSTDNLQQMGIASARYSSAGQHFEDSSASANTYILSPVSPFRSPVSSTAGEVYFIGMRITFKTANANTGASTVNVNSLGVKSLKKSDGTTDVTTGDIPAGQYVTFIYNGTHFVKQNQTPATSTAQGISYLTTPVSWTNNTTDANNDIDYTTGVIDHDDGSGQSLATTALTKQLDATFVAGNNQGGLDTGTKANSTWYQIFAITNNTTNAVDYLFSASRTSPTIPSGWTRRRWLGAIRTNASGNIDQAYFAIRTPFGQQVAFQTGEVATGTTLIPKDDTKPQNTEGTQFMELLINFIGTKSKILIDIDCSLASSTTQTLTIALFQDSTASCLASKGQLYFNANYPTSLNLKTFINSQGLSSSTFKVRAGGDGSATTTFNGASGARLYGGSLTSYIIINEYI